MQLASIAHTKRKHPRVHAMAGDRPLCGITGNRVTTYQAEIGECNCRRCLAKLAEVGRVK